MMFLLRGTTDTRTRTCTATAGQALRHHDRMSREGVAPIVTDYAGRRLSLAELKQRAEPDGGLLRN